MALKVPTQNGRNLKQQVGWQAGPHPEPQAGSGQVGVPVVEEKGQEMEEAVLSVSGLRKAFLKEDLHIIQFSAPQIAVFS